MVAYLSKSDASEGFNQIIDFLNGSSIKYELTMNPNIYVSCIKQFWTTVTIKQVNDVTRLQVLVDKKKVVVMEATFREALCLDNEEGVKCLPNEDIFAMLARMGYEKPSTKLTFYKAFFSSQKQVGDLSTHTTKYTSPALTQKLFANIRRVGKGILAVETPLFESMVVEQQVDEEGDADENVKEVNVGDATKGDVSTAHGEVLTIVEEPSIPSPTPPTPPPQPSQDIPLTSQRVGTAQRVETSDETMLDDVSNQGRMIAEMDQDTDVVLEDDKEVAEDDKEVANAVKDKDETEPAEVQEVVDVVTTAKLITDVVIAASETITASSTNITAAEAQVLAVTLTVSPARVVVAPSRRRKGEVIRDPKEESTTSTIIPAETKSKDKGKGIFVEEPKPLKKK
nr:hypothetical protein [Tanacetum cinerariifolium]